MHKNSMLFCFFTFYQSLSCIQLYYEEQGFDSQEYNNKSQQDFSLSLLNNNYDTTLYTPDPKDNLLLPNKIEEKQPQGNYCIRLCKKFGDQREILNWMVIDHCHSNLQEFLECSECRYNAHSMNYFLKEMYGTGDEVYANTTIGIAKVIRFCCYPVEEDVFAFNNVHVCIECGCLLSTQTFFCDSCIINYSIDGFYPLFLIS